jgi:hypothetical protein
MPHFDPSRPMPLSLHPAKVGDLGRDDALIDSDDAVFEPLSDPPHAADGVRVMADRLWPGGLSPQIVLWLKEIAPSDAVRRRFHGDPAAKSDLVTAILLLLSRPRRGRPP